MRCSASVWVSVSDKVFFHSGWAVPIDIRNQKLLVFPWRFPCHTRGDFVVNCMGNTLPDFRYKRSVNPNTERMTWPDSYRTNYAYTECKYLVHLPPRSVWFINDHLEEVNDMPQMVQLDANIINNWERYWNMVNSDYGKIAQLRADTKDSRASIKFYDIGFTTPEPVELTTPEPVSDSEDAQETEVSEEEK